MFKLHLLCESTYWLLAVLSDAIVSSLSRRPAEPARHLPFTEAHFNQLILIINESGAELHALLWIQQDGIRRRLHACYNQLESVSLQQIYNKNAFQEGNDNIVFLQLL